MPFGNSTRVMSSGPGNDDTLKLGDAAFPLFPFFLCFTFSLAISNLQSLISDF